MVLTDFLDKKNRLYSFLQFFNNLYTLKVPSGTNLRSIKEFFDFKLENQSIFLNLNLWIYIRLLKII